MFNDLCRIIDYQNFLATEQLLDGFRGRRLDDGAEGLYRERPNTTIWGKGERGIYDSHGSRETSTIHAQSSSVLCAVRTPEKLAGSRLDMRTANGTFELKSGEIQAETSISTANDTSNSSSALEEALARLEFRNTDKSHRLGSQRSRISSGEKDVVTDAVRCLNLQEEWQDDIYGATPLGSPRMTRDEQTCAITPSRQACEQEEEENQDIFFEALSCSSSHRSRDHWSDISTSSARPSLPVTPGSPPGFSSNGAT